jgi:hypothetical protein
MNRSPSLALARRAATITTVVLAGALNSCGDARSPLAGTWVSTASAIMHTDTARAVFATAELTIGPMGEISGSFRTISPTSVVGETGAASGTIALNTASTGTVNMTVAFSTLGTFRVNGPVVYAAATSNLAISSATTRDSANAVVGSMSATFQRQ